MLDSDLATLYEVETKVLNQAVKRDISRFPHDFKFSTHKGRAGAMEVTICDVQSEPKNGLATTPLRRGF